MCFCLRSSQFVQAPDEIWNSSSGALNAFCVYRIHRLRRGHGIAKRLVGWGRERERVVGRAKVRRSGGLLES